MKVGPYNITLSKKPAPKTTGVEQGGSQGSCKVLRQAVDLRRCWRREAVIRRGISTVTSSDPPPGRSDLQGDCKVMK